VRILSLVALAPPVLIVFLTPVYPVYEYDFRMSLFWVGTYIAAGIFLLLMSWYREKNPMMKRMRNFTNLLSIVPVGFNFIMSNVMRSLDVDSLWRLNAFVIPILFVLFIVFAIKYGVLGIKLKVERYRLDTTIRALTSGTAILNHSIKNELIKIDALLERVGVHPNIQNEPACQRDIDRVQQSLAHMNQMVERIHGQMQDFPLTVENHRIGELVEKCVQQLATYYDPQQIRIVNEVSPEEMMLCDRLHVAEMVNNIRHCWKDTASNNSQNG
jgi:hypothetical protein